LLEDAPSIQSYLNGRLSLFISIEEERQLLRGLGAGSNELLGIFGRSGINTYTKLSTDDSVTAIARVIANTRGSSFLQPDAVIVHPTQWLKLASAQGRYGRHGRGVLRCRTFRRECQ
jgi:Phage capsid family